MDYLGCCFGEIFGDELACTLRCQLELNSGQILSQNYLASLSSLPIADSPSNAVSTAVSDWQVVAFPPPRLLTADYCCEGV